MLVVSSLLSVEDFRGNAASPEGISSGFKGLMWLGAAGRVSMGIVNGSRFWAPFSFVDSTDSGGECIVLAWSRAGSTRLSSVASVALTVSSGVICRLL